ncbi:DMT family transporter [Paraburkholderia phymatum]|uniref:DMT family transporter n=1 Tax=Paraburkholderia phymatum TaxID=148447 RepID=A0ACC6U834_9BURK
MITTSTNLRSKMAASLALLLFISFAWTGTIVFAKMAVCEVSPLNIVSARLTIAAIFLVCWLRVQKIRLQATPRSSCRTYFFIATFGHIVPFLLISWSLISTPASEGSVLLATTPVFSSLVSYLRLRRLPSIIEIVGVTLGFVGTMYFIKASIIPSVTDLSLQRLALVASAASFAISGGYAARLPPDANVRSTAAIICWACVIIIPISLVIDPPTANLPSSHTLIILLLLGTVSTAIAYVSYYKLVSTDGLVFASTHHYLVPAIGVVVDSYIFNETLSLQQLYSVALILAGVALSCSGAWRRNRQNISKHDGHVAKVKAQGQHR